MIGFFDYTVILTYLSLLSAGLGVLVSLHGDGHPYWGVAFLLISGGASCCASQVEFVPSEAPEDLERLTLSDELITVQGVLDIFNNGGYDDIRLIEARIERAAL